MFSLLDFAMTALQNPDLMATQMASAGITPPDMQAQLQAGLGQMAQPMQPNAMDNGVLPPGAGQPQVPKLDMTRKLTQPSVDVASAGGMDQSVYGDFMREVQAGVHNPHGLAAVAATGDRESGFSAANARRSWDDVGQPAGGIMSWRGPRLNAMVNYAGAKDVSQTTPAQQGQFFLRENPQLIEKLNSAKSADEAMGYMNDAWAFKGFDNPDHPEYKARFQAANRYSQDFGAGGTGSTIDFARSENVTQQTQAPPGGGIEGSSTSHSGQVAMSGVPQGGTGPTSFGDRLAKLGQGLKNAGVGQQQRQEQRPPQAPAPNVGGGFARDPNSMAKMLELLGPGIGGAGQVPSLASMIRPMTGG